MSDRPTIGLDNPAFQGRLRRIDSAETSASRSVSAPAARPSAKYFNNNIVTKQHLVQDIVAPTNTPEPIPDPIPKPIPKPEPEITEQPAAGSILPFDHLVELQMDTAPTLEIEPSSRSKKASSRTQKTLLAMAVVVFLVGIFVSAITLKTNNNAKAQVSALSKQTSNDNDNAPPDETKPGNISSYQVAPNMPKFIKIPSLDINSRVKPVGVTNDNALKAPSNIYDAGWYNASAKPGDPGSMGAMLIDGHVHGPTLPGVFANIKNMKANDIITIQRGDDKKFNYKVIKVQSFDSDTLDMSIGLTSAQPGQPGLNLITCGGRFNQKTGHYDQRTIVSAVLQS